MKARDKDNYCDLIALNYDVSFVQETFSFVIRETPVGDITYFPKSNKIQIHADNRWLINGLDWLTKNLELCH